MAGETDRQASIVALIMGSCLLCTSASFAGDNAASVTITFRAAEFVGLAVSLFFAQRLIREMKRWKQIVRRTAPGMTGFLRTRKGSPVANGGDRTR